jgi:hypothetical protein
MLDIQAALSGLTGKSAMGVFQTLSAGNIAQLGAPGTGVPADAVEEETPTTMLSHFTPTAMHANGPAILCRRTSAPSLPQRRYPTRGASAVKGQRTDKRH